MTHDPRLLGRLIVADCEVMVDAADRGGVDAVGLMLDLGFPPDVRGGADGVTPLYAAAGSGSVPVVRLLLGRGTDINAHHTTWHSTPIAWATVVSG